MKCDICGAGGFMRKIREDYRTEEVVKLCTRCLDFTAAVREKAVVETLGLTQVKADEIIAERVKEYVTRQKELADAEH